MKSKLLKNLISGEFQVFASGKKSEEDLSRSLRESIYEPKAAFSAGRQVLRNSLPSETKSQTSSGELLLVHAKDYQILEISLR